MANENDRPVRISSASSQQMFEELLAELSEDFRRGKTPLKVVSPDKAGGIVKEQDPRLWYVPWQEGPQPEEARLVVSVGLAVTLLPRFVEGDGNEAGEPSVMKKIRQEKEELLDSFDDRRGSIGECQFLERRIKLYCYSMSCNATLPSVPSHAGKQGPGALWYHDTVPETQGPTIGAIEQSRAYFCGGWGIWLGLASLSLKLI